jgi:hypothetical protein
MKSHYGYEQNINEEAKDDFDKAKKIVTLTKLLNFFSPDKLNLLSLKEVKKILKPKKEAYIGMKAVKISHIVGSEGRYQDFNKAFLPRHEYLRSRWENVDKAYLKDINLPSIKLYEIGGVFFVRDGNHRVSVAKAKGFEAIDAEVVKLDSEINLNPKMTKDDLKRSVILYEKKSFYKKTKLKNIINPYELDFTDTGRYDEVMLHIYVHKYYINQSRSHEIPLEEAAGSWYSNIFKPIIDFINEKKILYKFPGRTGADLYMWVVHHWDDLKKKYGNDYPIQEAVRDYSERHGKNFWQIIRAYFMNLIKKK